MKHALTPCEFELLCYVLAELEAFSDIDRRLLESDLGPVKAMRDKGVPYRPTHWKSGAITSAKKMAYTRAIRKLEQANMVTRQTHKSRDRTAFVKPTKTAIALLLERLGDRVDRKDLSEGLSLTNWGQSLAQSLSL